MEWSTRWIRSFEQDVDLCRPVQDYSINNTLTPSGGF